MDVPWRFREVNEPSGHVLRISILRFQILLFILNANARLIDVIWTSHFNLKDFFGEITVLFGRPKDVPKARFLVLPFSP